MTTEQTGIETSGQTVATSIERAIELLESLNADRGQLARVDEATRQRLLIAAGRISRPDRIARKQLVKEFHRHARKSAADLQRRTKAGTGIRKARLSSVYVPPAPVALPSGYGESTSETNESSTALRCYVCKLSYTNVHHFYDAMCPACADLNYRKRFFSAPLDGRVALVTGGRVKIGYQTALKLLRAGAEVIVTTRFPNDAAQRFAAEADFSAWQNRLRIFGLDLRHAPSVEILATWLEARLKRLDILVNNAAQTVRRPAGWYQHLLAFEARPVDALAAGLQPLLADYQSLSKELAHGAPALRAADDADAKADALRILGGTGPFAAGITHAAILSQVRVCTEDSATAEPELFPEGKLDVDLQQVDLRATNSWRLRLGEVATGEMLEVHLVNAVAPFILCGRLRPLMERTPGDKFIINASAMEGKFTRYVKTDKHPHTNMAKAALNMMTLTSAQDYVRAQIYMNAVDTGWVTDEDPHVHAARKQTECGFEPPLDIVDGAARLLDPIFSAVAGDPPMWGKFLKDYMPTSW